MLLFLPLPSAQSTQLYSTKPNPTHFPYRHVTNRNTITNIGEIGWDWIKSLPQLPSAVRWQVVSSQSGTVTVKGENTRERERERER